VRLRVIHLDAGFWSVVLHTAEALDQAQGVAVRMAYVVEPRLSSSFGCSRSSGIFRHMRAVIEGSTCFRDRVLLASVLGAGHSRVELPLSFEVAHRAIVSQGNQVLEIAAYLSSLKAARRSTLCPAIWL
jgi:hypothetical protein